MKRDMDLIREVLIAIEKFETVQPHILSIKGYDEQTVAYNITLLKEAGLVEARTGQIDSKLYAEPIKLTWAGHEFLESIQNKNVWEKTKQFVSKNGGGLALSVVKDLAISYLRKEMELS
jgi:hypothetical protein